MECSINAPIDAIEKMTPRYPSRFIIAPIYIPIYPVTKVTATAVIIFFTVFAPFPLYAV